MHRRKKDGQLVVSATDLVGFLECGHLTRLERAAAAGLVPKPNRDDPEVELLQRRGELHEQRYVDHLVDNGRVITDLSPAEGAWTEYEARAVQTIEAMGRGDDVIFQATVFDGRWVGHPDFLLRVGGAGELGRDHHYEVADTKLAHSAKASALLQICHYVDQITRIQEIQPAKVHVVTGGADIGEHAFRTAEMMAYYRHAKRRFEEALDDAVAGAPAYPVDPEVSYPDPTEHCSVCRWFAACNRQWHEDDALTIVAGISRSQRTTLTELDIRSRGALARQDPLADEFRKVQAQALIQVESDPPAELQFRLLDPERDADGALVGDRGLSALPEPSAGDLFFDIEGDPFADWEGLDYLFGVWDAAGRWQRFWALDRTAEKRAFEQVMDLFNVRLDADPNMHIYHYAPYEPTALKRLAARHGTREFEVDQLLRGNVLVDLYRVVRQSLIAGVESYSIKRLEPLYGYVREINLRDANRSIVEFEAYLDLWHKEGRRDQGILDTIEAYNRDDCVSTQRLRDWLEERRHQAASEFGVELPRPRDVAPEVAAQIKPQAQEVIDLENALTTDLPAVPEQDPDQHARWLLAQLLDWHNRERKSSWWRFYELMSLSPDELRTQKEPISDLAYEGIVGANRAGNLVHRYRFPAQEHDVSDKSELHDPAKPAFDGSKLGSFVLDGANLTLDVTRKPDWVGTHPLAVVPSNIVWSVAQESALMSIGRWVVEHGIDSESVTYRAARDLLRRLPPRAGQAEGEKLTLDLGDGADETGKDAACRLATQLDGTTFAIQGPPGTGKTYTGARMILALIKAGRRVGITSNSHKVIGNLLRDVCDAAAEDGYPLRPMQKGEKKEVATHDRIEIRRAGDNKDVIAALEAGEVEVVGGTPWLWAREDMEGRVDTIFVDEAGQVSLANVVALSTGSRNVVLLGDPQQLDQPTQGVHPDGAGVSALAHLLGGAEVIDPHMGVFFEETWRMHPRITAYTSALFYDGELHSLAGLEQQAVLGEGKLSGSGLRWVAVEHDGRTDASPEEADEVARIWRELVSNEWVDQQGRRKLIGPEGIVIVAAFNAHRRLIEERLQDARVGTVDKFQGQQAPVSIYTMATSRPEDAPRGMGFLYSLNRLNVATSRARALAIVVASPRLLDAVARTPAQLRMANALVAFAERAEPSG